MARSPRRSPRGRRKAEASYEPEPIPIEPIEELEPIPASRGRGGARRGGGGRAAPSGGMTIGAKILCISIPPVAIVALLFGLLIFMKSGDDSGPVVKPIAEIDAGGVAAVRMLATPDPSAWDPRAMPILWGAVRDGMMAERKKELEAEYPTTGPDRDSRHDQMHKDQLAEFETDILDRYVPKDRREATRLKQILTRFDRAELGGGFLSATLIVDTGKGRVSNKVGNATLQDRKALPRIGGTRIAEGRYQGGLVRQYQHDVLDWRNQKVGTAEVLVKVPAPPATKKSGGGAGTLALLMIVLVIGAAVVSAVVLTSAISSPLKGLVRDIDAVARGDAGRRFETRGGGEIGLIAWHLDKMTRSLAAQAEAEVVQQTAEAEFSIATQIQENLLPDTPPRIEGYEIEALHKPSPDLGTDYHDFIEIDENHLGIIVADASAKGTTGAMIMSQIRSLIRAFGPDITSPAETLREVNRVFAMDLRKGLYVTAAYMVLNRESGVISVANAGHLPTVFWKLSKRAIARLPGEGLALGLDGGPVFDQKIDDKRVQLEAGDRVLLYTDGAVEAQNVHEEQFGEDAFFELVKKESPKNSAAFVNMVANEIDLFHEGAVQKDDISLVTIRKVR